MEQDLTTLSPRHALFVLEMIKHGKRKFAYLSAYPSASDNTARINACKLMKDPAIIAGIAQGIAGKQLRIESAEIKAWRKMERLIRMRALLAQIMAGELETKTVTTTKTGEIWYMKTFLDPGAMLRAIKHDLVVDEKLELARPGFRR